MHPDHATPPPPGPAETGTGPVAAPDPVAAAIEVLFAARHDLTPGALRSLADIWSCGSAARYGAPHEEFWDLAPDFYTEHDTASCEAENTIADEIVVAVRNADRYWIPVARITSDGSPLETIRINAAEVGHPVGTEFRLSLVRDFDGEDLELHTATVQAQ